MLRKLSQVWKWNISPIGEQHNMERLYAFSLQLAHQLVYQCLLYCCSDIVIFFHVSSSEIMIFTLIPTKLTRWQKYEVLLKWGSITRREIKTCLHILVSCARILVSFLFKETEAERAPQDPAQEARGIYGWIHGRTGGGIQRAWRSGMAGCRLAVLVVVCYMVESTRQTLYNIMHYFGCE